jgi:hypothetical protein
MADHLNVIPDEFRRAARQHREAADQLGAVPAIHAELIASLESLGPIFGEFREAGRQVLEQRRICYEEQAAAHADLADKLDLAAGIWEQQDADAAAALQGLAQREIRGEA